MSIKCQYYAEGMCVYVNKKFAIYESCIYEKVIEPRQESIDDCVNKKAIKALERNLRINNLEDITNAE